MRGRNGSPDGKRFVLLDCRARSPKLQATSRNRSFKITFIGTTVRIKGSMGTTIGNPNAMKSLVSIGMTFIRRIRS